MPNSNFLTVGGRDLDTRFATAVGAHGQSWGPTATVASYDSARLNGQLANFYAEATHTHSYAPVSHAHGNITNAGAVGSTANLPLITGTAGAIVAGSFGTAANTFCEGNDARLSDSRTPLSHALTGHTVSGLTNGHFLKATGANTFGFAAHGLTYTDVGAAAAGHTHGAAAALGVVTSIGTPGTDNDLPTEKAVRDALGLITGAPTGVAVLSEITFTNWSGTPDGSLSNGSNGVTFETSRIASLSKSGTVLTVTLTGSLKPIYVAVRSTAIVGFNSMLGFLNGMDVLSDNSNSQLFQISNPAAGQGNSFNIRLLIA